MKNTLEAIENYSGLIAYQKEELRQKALIIHSLNEQIAVKDAVINQLQEKINELQAELATHLPQEKPMCEAAAARYEMDGAE